MFSMSDLRDAQAIVLTMPAPSSSDIPVPSSWVVAAHYHQTIHAETQMGQQRLIVKHGDGWRNIAISLKIPPAGGFKCNGLVSTIIFSVVVMYSNVRVRNDSPENHGVVSWRNLLRDFHYACIHDQWPRTCWDASIGLKGNPH
jgi:hypothetical protein